MSKIGYIRVSTEHQETARQQEIMCDYQVDRIFSEKLSWSTQKTALFATDRPQLHAMLDYVRDGDTLYIESISRLGRSTKDLLNIIDTLTEKGVTLVSHKENIDTDTPSGKFMLTVFAALSQLEREQLKQRQREGIEIAKRKLPVDVFGGNVHRTNKFVPTESPLRSTGRGSGSFMGNGSQRTSQAGTLCGEWACRLIHSIAVRGSMKLLTALPSQLLLDNSRQRNGEAPQHRPTLRSGKLNAYNNKPSETLAGRFRGLAVGIQFQ